MSNGPPGRVQERPDVSKSVDLHLDSMVGADPTTDSVPTRTRLQHRAPSNILRHWYRGMIRVSVLAASDLGTYFGLRLFINALRDGLVGPSPAGWVNSFFPAGYLEGPRFAVALILSLLAVGAFGAGDRRRDTGRMFGAVALAAGLVLYGAWWASPVVLSLQFAVTLTLVGASLAGTRLVVDYAVRRVKPLFRGSRTVIVAHEGIDERDLLDTLRELREFVPVEVLAIDGSETKPDKRLFDLGRVIEERSAESVLLWGSLTDAEFNTAVDLALASGCRLLATPRIRPGNRVDARTVWINGSPLLEYTAPHLQAWQLALKWVMDFLVASIGLVVLSPLFLVVALTVKLESPGPVFFRQWRVGRAGKRFRILKFRSMVADAESQRDAIRKKSIYVDDRLFKIPNDPRVTRVGRWLRRTSIDELPQLINVILGQMSLVGPRPPIPGEVEQYDERHLLRFDVKPGITGPWQVSGRNKITDFEQVIHIEKDYIRGWTISRDIWILLRTIPVVLRMNGAH